MDEKLFRQINEQTDIVSLVSEFVSLAKKGKNYMGLCPFHQEKTASFSVSVEKNIAKCMSCKAGGTPIIFYKEIKNISLEQAAFELAQRAGIKIMDMQVKKDPHTHYYKLMKDVVLFYSYNLKNSEKGQQALKYLSDRQISDDLVIHFNLGYSPPHGDTLYRFLKDKEYSVSDMISLGVVKQADDGKYYDLFSNRIIFPITNSKGDTVGLSGRALNPNDKVKYINSPETVIFKKGLLLYHLYEALNDIRITKQVVIYEGFFDVISSYSAGVKNGVATMGTALTTNQAKLIKSVAPAVLIAYDGDEAGLSATDKSIPILQKQGLKVEVLTIPDKMDPDDFIIQYGPEKFETLFGEYTKDAFLFRYDYYKRNKVLVDANDIEEFKNQVMQMIRFADIAIKSFYINKLAEDLNISSESLETVIKRAPKRVVRKTKQIKMIDRHEKAERYIIFAMLRSTQAIELVKTGLKQTDFAHSLAAAIRLKIENYYEDYKVLNLEDFLEKLPQELSDYLKNQLFQDMFWTHNIDISNQDIESYIEVVKEANLKRRLNYLEEKMTKVELVSDKVIIERDNIIIQLMKKK